MSSRSSTLLATSSMWRLAFLAVWGVYNGILLYRTLSKKTLKDPEQLIKQVQELCQARKFDAAVTVCQSPIYWHKALAQLIAVALRNRDKGLAKIKQLLVTEFHTEVIAGMENRLASISTIVRMGPLLGLLGTVASMIAAFNRIGGAEQVNPRALASDISLALWATGAGLLIANPDDAHRQRRPCAAAQAQGSHRTAASGHPGDSRASRESGACSRLPRSPFRDRHAASDRTPLLMKA